MAGKIAVIGDVMLDMYDYCKNRDNPESSAPCYTIVNTEYKPGGAGNVAANLVKLGSNLELISVIGDNHVSDDLIKKLDEFKIPCRLIRDPNRQTIVKERILSIQDGRCHCRLDREIIEPINPNHVYDILEYAKNADLIIVSDYEKGLITSGLMEKLKETEIPILVDPKPSHKEFYKDVYMITPNIKEAVTMAGIHDEMLAAEKLQTELSTNVLLTRSEKGISYFGLNGDRYDFPAEAKEVFDVTGAGDTVIATFAHFFNKKYDIKEAIRLANKAGGISVGHVGCYQVSEKELGVE